MLSMVCMCALQEGPHHALLSLLNPEPSAEALDGWRKETGRGKCGNRGRRVGTEGGSKKRMQLGVHLQFDDNRLGKPLSFNMLTSLL